MTNGIYEPGETVHVLASILPGAITPRPEGVPAAAKLRIILTKRSITVAWAAGSIGGVPMVQRWDVELSEEESASVSSNGGVIGAYNVLRGSGCPCGSAELKSWNPFPECKIVNGVPTSRVRYSQT